MAVGVVTARQWYLESWVQDLARVGARCQYDGIILHLGTEHGCLGWEDALGGQGVETRGGSHSFCPLRMFPVYHRMVSQVGSK